MRPSLISNRAKVAWPLVMQMAPPDPAPPAAVPKVKGPQWRAEGTGGFHHWPWRQEANLTPRRREPLSSRAELPAFGD